MTKNIRADLHVHTCLSPCGDNEMVPKTIVEKAFGRGLNLIAICDHNACENVKVVARVAQTAGIKVIPGMEATSKEEVHTLALFENIETALRMQSFILEKLKGENDERRFGEQIIVDEEGKIIGRNNNFLLGTPEIALEDLVSKIKELGGLAIASHIDREAYSVLGQLGFLPDRVTFDALEISSRISLNEAKKKYPGEFEKFPLITSSDAHFKEDIGKVFTELELKSPDFVSLKEYFEKYSHSEERK